MTTDTLHLKLAPIVATAALALFGAACDSLPSDLPAPVKPPPTTPQPEPEDHVANQPGAFSGGEENTFDHAGDLGGLGAKDVFQILSERQEEGPPEIRTRLHSCQKLQNTALRNILSGFGVDLQATAPNNQPPTAGQLLSGGLAALGGANYDARVGEAITWTSAGAAKLFDIFVQAAPVIIANLESAERCMVGGVGTPMFDEENRCVEDAVTCLLGRPAKPEHLAICDSIVNSASDLETGKRIAVASLLSAAHSCE